MIKLICFDLWETLVYEPSTSEYCWEPFARAHPDKISWTKIRELIASIAQRKDQSTDASTREILNNFGVIDEVLVSEIGKRWEHSCDQVQLFPETIEALRGLRDSGYKTGLITNTSRYGWDSINTKFALGGYFDYPALSFEIGYVKPEVEIFKFIEKKAGLKGADILMVGDSYKNDFLAPRKQGWSSALLNRSGKDEFPDAKPIIHNLLQLKKIIL